MEIGRDHLHLAITLSDKKSLAARRRSNQESLTARPAMPRVVTLHPEWTPGLAIAALVMSPDLQTGGR
jgi:hypothetical protein